MALCIIAGSLANCWAALRFHLVSSVGVSMLSATIFETLRNVDDVLRYVQDEAYREHRARVLKAYADLIRVQWDIDTLPGSEPALANYVAKLTDLELIQRRAELLRYAPPVPVDDED